MSSDSNPAQRSLSRGREPLYSSGRGGVGNIRPTSTSRDPVLRHSGPDDYSPTRGRELADRRIGVTTTGRGGAGNLRSSSRDARTAVQEAIMQEARYIRGRNATQSEQVYFTGRGGAGNMSRSRSRSCDPSLPTPPNGITSTGHGGFGNLTNDGRLPFELCRLEEEDRKIVEREEATQHSAGGSGYGHQAAAQPPAQDRRPIQHDLPAYIAGGRGGAGNIHATAAY